MNIFNFTQEEFDKWEIENDTVMGGKSESEIHHVNLDGADMMKFSGHVSLENNGGFAQTQCEYDDYLDLSLFNQFEIVGKGDGKVYNLRIETADSGVSYQSEFTATETFKEIIKFESLKKIHHGEPVPDKPDFDKSKMKSICILIGNKVEEDFEINIDQINALA